MQCGILIFSNIQGREDGETSLVNVTDVKPSAWIYKATLYRQRIV